MTPRRWTVPPRHRAALALTAVLVGLGADWEWVAGPRVAALLDAWEVLAARQVELTAARQEAAAHADTKRAVREAAHALRRAAARLPDRRELGALLAAFADRARTAGLILLLLRPQPERRVGDHVEVPVELQLRGPFVHIVDFLRAVEGLGRLVRVGDVRLEHPEALGAHTMLRAACTVVTYRLVGDVERPPRPAGESG